ncbi:MAG: hypothetical protein KBA30_03590 [Clostridia bacterium]|nr:hypothetical protein [Clostridia bacterium]
MSVNADTRACRKHRYGLVGHPLAHSLSPFIHGEIMEALGIQGTYELIDIPPEDLDTLLPRVLDQLDGFNITIPHKEKVIAHLTGCHPSAARYGAVNTVFRRTGYNTDGTGFLSSAPPLAGKDILLLGAGGVSRTMGFEAAYAGAASIRILSPGLDKARRLAADIRTKTGIRDISVVDPGDAAELRAEVILNGSPLGMWPRIRGVPISHETACAAEHVFDSVYNPPATRLLLHARTGGAQARSGLAMLFGQAVEAQRIWNPGAAWEDPDVLARLARIPARLSRELVRRDAVKYVFTGFMGSGKSTVGRLVAERIGIPFLDLDDRICAAAGRSIPAIFAQDGEAVFRQLEAGILDETLREPGSAVVATGGGALLQPDAMRIVDASPALVVLLDTLLERILTRVGRHSGRPLMDGDALEKAERLYRDRMPEYRACADLVMENNGPENAARVAARTAEALGFGEEGMNR